MSAVVYVWAVATVPVQAQEDLAIAGDEREVEELTVTGSRLRRDEFSSISPVSLPAFRQSVR
jgi:hypothetical protein